jgi:hypothetical protein
LGTWVHGSALAPGSNYTSSVTVNIPGDAREGMIYLIVRTDSAGSVFEADENNNTRVVRPPAAPQLSLGRGEGFVEIKWSGVAGGLTLESAPQLSSPVWLTVTEPVFVVGPTNVCRIVPSDQQRFFRLKNN